MIPAQKNGIQLPSFESIHNFADAPGRLPPPEQPKYFTPAQPYLPPLSNASAPRYELEGMAAMGRGPENVTLPDIRLKNTDRSPAYELDASDEEGRQKSRKTRK